MGWSYFIEIVFVCLNCLLCFVSSSNEERRLKVCENTVLRIFGPKRQVVVEAGVDYIMRSFITCTIRQTLLECRHVARTREMEN